MDTESNPYSMSTPLVKLLIEERLIDIINKKNGGIARGISVIAKWTTYYFEIRVISLWFY